MFLSIYFGCFAKTNVVPKQTDSPYNNMKLKKCTENDTKRLI
ncbi:hypothetical protein RUMOBE_01226 [Blautia obeum ATCC 29174]|uniref:Uncharacterized protein n=1 Tax=Blautia obeum ATCC 29174 TaxID=411459 RepID=A5ZQF6_9FIRM|nr:hypothetical protein RUMOBE_01226 [Blautia obeum ATCC 29174]